MEVKSNYIKNSSAELKGSKRKIKSSSGNVLDSPCANVELELSNEKYFQFGKSMQENKKINKIQSKTKRSGYSILPHICYNCEQHCEANDVPENSQGNCYCSSCIESSDTETMDSVSEWRNLSGVVQGVLNMQSDCLQNVPLIKAQVLKMCIMDSPNLFKSLAKVSKEAVIDMKVQVMKRLVQHSLESRQNFLSTLLLKYQSLCAACEILADILSPLVDEYLKLFHITWQLFGKHLYNRIIFNDPVMQKFFHKALNHIRKVLSSSNEEEVHAKKDESPKCHEVNKLDDNTIIIHNNTNNNSTLDEKEYTRLLVDCESFLLEMKKVEEAWKPCQRLLEEYDHKQAQMQLNEQLWRDDYHFFMSQRKLLQQLVHKTSTSSDCSKQLEQFSQMFKHKNKEYSCPTCRNFKCSYNESGMSHLITCGLINPDVTPIDEDDEEEDGGEEKDEEGVDDNEIDLFTTDADKLQAYLEMMRPEACKERTSSSSSSCSTSSLLDGISSLKLPQFDEQKKNGVAKSEEEDDDDDDDDDDDFHDAQQMHYIDFTYPYSAVDKDGNKIEIDPDTLPTLSELEAKTLNTYKTSDRYLIKHTNDNDKALKAESLADQEYSKSSMQFVKLLFRNQQKRLDDANKPCHKNESKFLLPSLIQQQHQNNHDNTLKLCLKEKNLSDILSNNNHLLNISRDKMENKVTNTTLTSQKNHLDRESSSVDYEDDNVNHACNVVNNFENSHQNDEEEDKQNKQLLKKQPPIEAPHKHLYKIYKQRSKQQVCNGKKVTESKSENPQATSQGKPTSCKNSCEKSKEDCSNANDKVNSQKNHCECWHCEFFGHDTPSTAPVSKNFTECRDRLRQKLKKKKGHSCLNTTTTTSKTTTTISSTTTTITTSTTTTSISTKKSNCSNSKESKSTMNKTTKMTNSSSMEDLLKFINGLDARIEMNEGKEKKGKKNKNKKLNKVVQDKSNDHLLNKNTVFNNENNDINNNIYNNAFNDTSISKNVKNFDINSLSDHVDSKDLFRKYKDIMCQENSIRVVKNSKHTLINNISLHDDEFCRNNADNSKFSLKKTKPVSINDKTNSKEPSKPHLNGFKDKHQASTDVLKHDCNVNSAKPTLLLDSAFVSLPLSPKKSYNSPEVDRSRNFKQENNRISSLSPASTSLPPPPATSLSTLTASPSSKNKRNKKRNKIEVNNLIEEVFKPCEEDVGDYDREIEDFKRFCFNAPSYPAKEKVNLNMKDIINRRRIANHI